MRVFLRERPMPALGGRVYSAPRLAGIPATLAGSGEIVRHKLALGVGFVVEIFDVLVIIVAVLRVPRVVLALHVEEHDVVDVVPAVGITAGARALPHDFVFVVAHGFRPTDRRRRNLRVLHGEDASDILYGHPTVRVGQPNSEERKFTAYRSGLHGLPPPLLL